MKIVFAVAMISVLAVPVYAQGLNGKAPPGPPPGPAKSEQEIRAERAAEQAYKNSLRNIPDKPPADPWGNARCVDTSTTPKAAKSPTKPGGSAN
jgi:hypothetical protein